MSAFVIACVVGAEPIPLVERHRSFLDSLLGASRGAFGTHFVLQADRFFHLGSRPTPPQAFTNTFTRWSEEISPRLHRHLDVTEVREMMPWLRMATKMNPQNAEAYTIAAYWMEQTGMTELAEEILREGQMNNPNNYRIYAAAGQLYFHQGKVDKARTAFDKAIDSWTEDPDNADSRFELARILSFRGVIHEIDGYTDEAIRCYELLAQFIPESPMRGRINQLRAGEQPLSLTSAAIQSMFRLRGESHMMSAARSLDDNLLDAGHDHEHCDDPSHHHEEHDHDHGHKDH